MTTPNTPQSTKKIEEKLKEILNVPNVGESYEDYFDVHTLGGEMECVHITDEGKTKLTQQLLTILKETCEAVIGEDEKVPQSETGINLAPIIGTEPRNQLRADQRTTLNNLLGADDE